MYPSCNVERLINEFPIMIDLRIARHLMKKFISIKLKNLGFWVREFYSDSLRKINMVVKIEMYKHLPHVISILK